MEIFTDQINEISPQIYNAYDVLICDEVFENLNQLPKPGPIYNFSLALQAPAMEMSLRGIKVNIFARDKAIRSLRKNLLRVDEILQRLVTTVWSQPWKLNPKGEPTFPNSDTQLRSFFYDTLGIKPITRRYKGEVSTPMDRAVLEKLQIHFQLRPILAFIIAHRDICGQLEVLETGIDPDKRMRCSFNIAATVTGRFSTSKSTTGSGKNLQNVTEDLRYQFVCDDGYKLASIDKEQAESREVGWLCGVLFDDWSYLNAIESGDIHTYTARLVWPNLPWTNDLKLDKQIANQSFYRHLTYRDMSKRCGHGCLTEDHEVLTPNGWVSIKEKPEIIMQFSKEHGSSFTKVSNWVDKEYSGEFHEWNGQSISVKMTRDHRVYYNTMGDGSLSIAPAYAVPKSAKVPNGWGYIGGNEKITPEIARLIAAYQCDGNDWSANRAKFHFHKDRKFMRLENLAIEANIPYSQRGEYAVLNTHGTNPWPKRAGAYLLNWDIQSLKAYLEELPHWDGHFAPTYVQLNSTDYEHLDWIRTCNRLIGIGGNIQKPKISGFGSTVYVLQYNNRQYASLSKVDREILEETNQVYCPTVPYKAFYIRRNHKISITGNTNYFGRPWTIANEIHAPQPMVKDFQTAYFRAFPCISLMHQWVKAELQTKGYLINVFGRKRDFFDRHDSDETLRAAIAYLFQSATADDLNLGMWRIWRYMPQAELLLQLHDAIYFQFPETENEEEIITQAQRLLDVELKHKDRSFIVPTEALTGFNFGHRYKLDENGKKLETNPRGLDVVRFH